MMPILIFLLLRLWAKNRNVLTYAIGSISMSKQCRLGHQTGSNLLQPVLILIGFPNLKMKMLYRLRQEQKEFIGKNLIDFMESREDLSQDAADFISNWIRTGPEEKTKAFYDVWDIVLSNYMPKTRPVLFRSCNRLVDDKIVSFTGSFKAIQRFSQGKGLLIICDTEELLYPLEFAETHPPQRPYRNTFFPIAELLRKEAQSLSCKFSESLINQFPGEDEYIMRVNFNLMSRCKFCKDNS